MGPKTLSGRRLQKNLKNRASMPKSAERCACVSARLVIKPMPIMLNPKTKSVTAIGRRNGSVSAILPPKIKKGMLRHPVINHTFVFGFLRRSALNLGSSERTGKLMRINTNATISKITRQTLPSPYLLSPKRRGWCVTATSVIIAQANRDINGINRCISP